MNIRTVYKEKGSFKLIQFKMNFSILALVLFIVTVAAWGDQGLGESDLSHGHIHFTDRLSGIVVKNNFRRN